MAVKAQRTCPQCGNRIKGHPNKKFCGPKCKDKYHNSRNPRGYYAYMKPSGDVERDPDDDEHPFSSEALGQE